MAALDDATQILEAQFDKAEECKARTERLTFGTKLTDDEEKQLPDNTHYIACMASPQTGFPMCTPKSSNLYS